MNTQAVEAIANAVLYEGYMLYPYRPSSVKNRQRFNFGVLYPKSYSQGQTGSDAWSLQTECLVEGTLHAAIEVKVRFLKLVNRSVWKLRPSCSSEDGSAGYESVAALEVDGRVFTPWQEAIECEVTVPVSKLNALTTTSMQRNFDFPAKEESENLGGKCALGLMKRNQESICGVVEIKVERAVDGIFKVRVRVRNLTSFQAVSRDADTVINREQALMRSLLSAHVVLSATDGQFVSLLESPENLKELSAGCENVGVWPVLVGAEGERSMMLASPIILYDYPEIAPESPGDLFDGTEIDEILALRIMTMTDAEKMEMRNTDDRARKILERTETLPMEHLMKLHGTLRELRPWKEELP
jgi:hydrogenase maturation protease